MNPVKDDAINIISQPKGVLESALIATQATDSTELANVVIRAAITQIEDALAKASPIRERTAYLKNAADAIQRALNALSRDWHHVTDEDTVDGRSHTTYSLVRRLKDARDILQEFLGEESNEDVG